MESAGGFAAGNRRHRLGVARTVGVVAIVALFVASMVWFLQLTSSTSVSEVAPELSSEADLALVDDDQGLGDQRYGIAQDPLNLALRVGRSPGTYNVKRVSRDGNDPGPIDPEIDLSLETDLFPPYSLAVRPSIEPGLYATRFGVENCSFELRRLAASGEEVIIGHDRLSEGRMLATVNDVEADVFDPSWSCGDWVSWTPLTTPLETAGSGDYWRSDLRNGDWTVSRGCEWEKVVGFRGADLADVHESGVGPGQLTIDGSTLGLRVRRCPGGLSWRGPLPEDEQ